MSTSNDNKKGMSSATSTSKPESTKVQPSGSKKGMEHNDATEDKKSDRSSMPTNATSKLDKDNDTKNNKNTKNK